MGVDGCRGGWIGAVVDGAPRLVVAERLESLLDAMPRLDAALVDMPIGLAEGDRACDKAARRILGARRSSVFAPPSRAQLEAHVAGRPAGLGAQVAGICAKLHEVDELARRRREVRLVESHPEVCFHALFGDQTALRKRLVAGRRQRITALAQAGEPWAALARGDLRPRSGNARAKPDDALDAIVLAWAATRFAEGGGEMLGDGGLDPQGLPMRIWCPRA